LRSPRSTTRCRLAPSATATKMTYFGVRRVERSVSVGEKVRMKPCAEVGSLGKPWIGDDLLASYLDKSAGLTKIGNTHLFLFSCYSAGLR